MLGHDPQAVMDGAGERRPPDRVALAEDCRAIQDRLHAIGRALGALVVEIDRTLERGSALPESAAGPRATSATSVTAK